MINENAKKRVAKLRAKLDKMPLSEIAGEHDRLARSLDAARKHNRAKQIAADVIRITEVEKALRRRMTENPEQ